MSTVIGLFGVGPFELLIVSVVLFVLVGIPLLALLLLIVRGVKSRPDRRDDPPRQSQPDDQ